MYRLIPAKTAAEAQALYELGCLADSKHNSTQAAIYYARSALGGHRISQYNMGIVKENGDGLTKDPSQALIWYDLAATNGFVEAQWRLVAIYTNGLLDQPINNALALHWAQTAANNGHVEAQWLLATIYTNGDLGQPINNTLALNWTKKAAEREHAQAQNILGTAYLYGIGLPEDGKLAVEWFTRAAKQKSSAAFFNLGVVYLHGAKGIPANIKSAAAWFEKAIEHKHPQSYAPLAHIYTEPLGDFKHDIPYGIKLLRQGVALNDARAQANLGVKYEHGIGVDRDYKTAFDLYQKSATQRDAPGQTNLGTMYATGRGTPVDYSLARHWYELAADQGDVKAASFLGEMYYRGTGVAQDDATAVKWLEKAAAKSDIFAMSTMGVMHIMGTEGLTVDKTTGVALLHQAAEAPEQDGSLFAWNNIATYYQDGVYTERNYPLAIKWHHKAAMKGCSGSQCDLALMYKMGLGVTQDDATAIYWWRQAAELGNQRARYNLGVMHYKAKNLTDAITELTKAATGGHLLAQEFLGSLYLEGEEGLVPDPRQALEWLKKAHAQGSRDARILLAQCYLHGKGGVERNLELGKAYLSECYSGLIAITADQASKAHAEDEKIAEPVVNVTPSSPPVIAAKKKAARVAAAPAFSPVVSHTRIAAAAVDDKGERFDETIDKLLIDLGQLRTRILHIAPFNNKAIIKKYLSKTEKTIENLNVLDLHLPARTLTARVNQFKKTYAQLDLEITEKEVLAVPAKRSASPSDADKKTKEPTKLPSHPPMSIPKKPYSYATPDKSEIMRQKLEALLGMLDTVHVSCTPPKVYSDVVKFYAVIAVIGETYNALVNFQDDAKYGHLYEGEKTWLARCNAFGDPGLVQEDLVKILAMPASLQAHLSALISHKGPTEIIKTPTALDKLLIQPQAEDLKTDKTRLKASLDHSKAAITELKASSTDLSDPINALAFAGACMRFDKAAVKLMAIDYGLYRTHYRSLHQIVAPIGRELRHFSFKHYHPSVFINQVRDQYADIESRFRKKPALSTEHFPLLPKPSSSVAAAGTGVLLTAVGFSSANTKKTASISATAASPAAAKKSPASPGAPPAVAAAAP